MTHDDGAAGPAFAEERDRQRMSVQRMEGRAAAPQNDQVRMRRGLTAEAAPSAASSRRGKGEGNGKRP